MVISKPLQTSGRRPVPRRGGRDAGLRGSLRTEENVPSSSVPSFRLWETGFGPQNSVSLAPARFACTCGDDSVSVP